MLNKDQRLNLRLVNLPHFFQHSKCVKSTLFKVYFKNCDKNNKNGVAVVVSRKVSLKATQRNKIKRACYLAIKKTLLENNDNWLFNRQIIFFMSKKTMQIDPKKLTAEITAEIINKQHQLAST